MKLIKCHINAFGKLKNFDYQFSNGINTIFGENGLGKTTFTIFLKAMFYGMPKKGNNKAYAICRSKYMPWEAGVYGGSLTIDVDGKIYTITRTFGTTPESDTFQLVDEKSGRVSQDYSKDIGFQLFGVGEETFEISAFLSQEGVSLDMNDEVRATLTGANKFENDLADATRAQKLISQKISSVKSECPKLVELEDLKREIRQSQNFISSLKQELFLQQDKFAKLRERHLNLEKQEKILKQEYANSLHIQEKQNLLKNQILSLQERLKVKEEEKLKTLKDKQSTFSKPQNNKTSKIGIIITVFLLILGASLIVASFFVTNQILLLTLGIAIIVASFVTFGILLIKMVGIGEKDKLLQKENLSVELKLAGLDNEIIELKVTLQNFEEQLKTQEQTEVVDFERALEEIHNIDKEKSLLEIKINNLKKDLVFQEEKETSLNDNLFALSEKRANSLKTIELLEKTKEYLKLAKDNISAKYLQPMQDAFNQLYLLFKANEKLSLDINLNVNQLTNIGLKEREYLSQGLQDVLSLCKRLSLLDKIFVNQKPFIVLDDPFVNLDDNKLEIAKTLLSKYAENYQIIYICSHSRCKI